MLAQRSSFIFLRFPPFVLYSTKSHQLTPGLGSSALRHLVPHRSAIAHGSTAPCSALRCPAALLRKHRTAPQAPQSAALCFAVLCRALPCRVSASNIRSVICTFFFLFLFGHISSCSHLCPKRRVGLAQFDRRAHVTGGLGAIRAVCRAWEALNHFLASGTLEANHRVYETPPGIGSKHPPIPAYVRNFLM